MNPHRDPHLASTERLVQLEDEVRALRGTIEHGAPRARPRRRSFWLLGLSLLALGGLGAAFAYGWWASQPASQTVLPTNAGLSVTVVFRASVDDVRFETADGKNAIPTFSAAVGGVSVDDRHEAASVRSAGVLLKPSLLAPEGPTRLRVHYAYFGIPRSATIEVDPVRDGHRFMQSTLEGLPQWVAFREYDGKLLLYFTTLLVYKPTLQEIRWGVGDEPLERSVRFTPSRDLGVDQADEIYARIPHETQQVRVQLGYRDGSRSEVRTILRSDAEIP